MTSGGRTAVPAERTVIPIWDDWSATTIVSARCALPLLAIKIEQRRTPAIHFRRQISEDLQWHQNPRRAEVYGEHDRARAGLGTLFEMIAQHIDRTESHRAFRQLRVDGSIRVERIG